MEPHDDDLKNFEAHGAAPLPVANDQGHVDHDGARIWYATYGSGAPVILLHGGLGHSGNWGYQVPALNNAGYQAVLIDGRGHGRSTRDARPYAYELMASDVLAVMDALHLEKAVLRGLERWRVHCVGSCQERAGAQWWRILLCLQHGSQRRQGNRNQSDPRPMFQPARDGLSPVVGHAGQIPGLG